MSSQALRPGGFLKVLPPVDVRIGWLASRCARISAIRRAIAAGSPGRPLRRAETKIQSLGAAEPR